MLKPLPFIVLIPNLFTLLSLAIGINSIRLAIDGHWESAVGSIVIASIIDGLDGRIARILNVSSKFGAELDSLCDLVNFGVAPGLMIYFWIVAPLDVEIKKLSWAISIIFIICVSIRLARFNIDSSSDPYDKRSMMFFKGIPSPAGGLLILLPIILDFKIAKIFNIDIKSNILAINIYSAIIALMMPSRVPTFSLKAVRINHEYVWLALLSFGIFIVLLTLYTWYILPLIAIIYVLSIFCSIVYARKIN
jgi:CDP-diacylglycerol--serine O-phosphatidyltransferase